MRMLLGFGVLAAAIALAASGSSSSAVAPIPRAPGDSGRIPEWTDADFETLVTVAHDIRCDPADLLLVLYSESRLKPSAVNRAGGTAPVAVGLNQITQVAADAMKISRAEWLAIPTLDVSTQLLNYVRAYFTGLAWWGHGGTLPNAARVYQANFAPGTLSDVRTRDGVLYASSSGAAYSQNKALDVNGDGSITLGDLSDWLKARSKDAAFVAALAELNSVTGRSFAPTFF